MLESGKKYIDEIMRLAKKAYKEGEVPIGAIIVKDDKIIARAYNKKEKKKVATYHAEILAIEKASKKIKDWRLNGSIMYVTLKPCDMCMNAIKEARISEVRYLADEKGEIKEKSVIKITKFKDEKMSLVSENLIKNFFRKKRK
ncbi:MAG: nucleoside deaminase [Bacilli bacterium]|jgi:tRNA(adenine34) deaminase